MLSSVNTLSHFPSFMHSLRQINDAHGTIEEHIATDRPPGSRKSRHSAPSQPMEEFDECRTSQVIACRRLLSHSFGSLPQCLTCCLLTDSDAKGCFQACSVVNCIIARTSLQSNAFCAICGLSWPLGNCMCRECTHHASHPVVS